MKVFYAVQVHGPPLGRSLDNVHRLIFQRRRYACAPSEVPRLPAKTRVQHIALHNKLLARCYLEKRRKSSAKSVQSRSRWVVRGTSRRPSRSKLVVRGQSKRQSRSKWVDRGQARRVGGYCQGDAVVGKSTLQIHTCLCMCE